MANPGTDSLIAGLVAGRAESFATLFDKGDLTFWLRP
jgi:hypothetical protein